MESEENKPLIAEDFNKDMVDLERVPLDEVFEQLRCSRSGLTSQEGELRLQIFGFNKLEEKPVSVPSIPNVKLEVILSMRFARQANVIVRFLKY